MKQGKKPETELRIASGTGEEIRADVSDNTLKAYEHAARRLELWLEGRALSDASLAEYVRFLHGQGKSPATINLVLSAVKWMAEYHGIDAVAGAATEGAASAVREKGKRRRRRQVDGLTWDDVERVCAAAESADTAAGLRDAVMISLMSDCLLRISEVVAVDVEDVKEEGLQVHGKKAGSEQGDVLYICDSTRRLIERYRRRTDVHSGTLFRRIRFQNHVTEDRLGVKGAREAIRRRAVEAGVEGLISGHSLRAGSALSLAEAGASVREVQRAGRWRDPTMPARYVREAPEEHSPVQRYKNGKIKSVTDVSHYPNTRDSERGFIMSHTHPTSRTYPGIPTPGAIEIAILQHVADGREYRFGAIYDAMAEYFKLTEEQLEMCFPYVGGVNPTGAGGGNVFFKYCNNACRTLMKKGLLNGIGAFYEDKRYKITPSGRVAAAQ